MFAQNARADVPQDLRQAGLNPYMVEIANIREQCSWMHKDMPTGTEKAIILAKAAVAKVALNAPLTPGESPVTKRALVIGGGIAGIQTALDIAEAGFPVDIVEKKPTIGGKMTQIDKTFPTSTARPASLRLKWLMWRRTIRSASTSAWDNRRAIYIPFAQAVPKVATIDPNYCKMFKTGKCGVCSERYVKPQEP